MFDTRTNLLCYLILIFMKLLGAQEVPNTSSNQGSSPSSLQPRFSDPGAMGFPNFGSGRFGNPTSNYPTNSFFPFGNQNNNMQRPQQGSGLGYPNSGNFQNRPQGYPQQQGYPNQEGYPNQQGYPNQEGYPNQQGYPNQEGYPNQQGYPNQEGYPDQPGYPNQEGYPDQQGYPNQEGYPYQGDSMNPNPNYQQPHYRNQNNQNRPVQGGYPNLDAFPYQGDSNTRYPNYQRPSYPNRPDDSSIMYPDDISSPYQNGGMPTDQGGPGQSFQYPQGNQFPSQGNFQGNGHPNIRPNEVNPNFRPDDVSNLPNTNMNFPDGPYQYQPNQYYPQNNSPNQYFRPDQGQPGSFPNYPSANYPNTNTQFPTNNLGGVNGDPSAIQYPDQAGSGISYPGPSVNPGDLNNVLQNQPPLPNNQGNIPNDNDTVAILGKPVIVPPTTTSTGQVVLDNSTTAVQKKCVQDCPTTSEYSPVCGTDNVTYINPGKFDCAQKCGVAVKLQTTGRCSASIVTNNLEQE